MTKDQIIEIYMFNSQKVLAEMLYDTITKYEKKINNLHIALDKANKRRKAQAEEINRLLANKQAVSDDFKKEKQELIDKYYNLANKYADLADKYTELKLKGK